MTTEIKLENVRLGYVNLAETAVFNGQDTNKYQVTILIPKSNKEQVKNIKELTKSTALTGKVKGDWKNPLKDGDDLVDAGADEAWANNYSLVARTKFEPVVVDQNTVKMTKEDITTKLTRGCIVNILVSPYFYTNTSKGVGYNIRAVQFVSAGELIESKDAEVKCPFSPLENSKDDEEVDL